MHKLLLSVFILLFSIIMSYMIGQAVARVEAQNAQSDMFDYRLGRKIYSVQKERTLYIQFDPRLDPFDYIMKVNGIYMDAIDGFHPPNHSHLAGRSYGPNMPVGWNVLIGGELDRLETISVIRISTKEEISLPVAEMIELRETLSRVYITLDANSGLLTYTFTPDVGFM